MAVYTYAQLEGLWIQAGGSPATAPLAAAIAEAESGGQSDAVSANPDGGTNVGPWQLDTLGKGSGYSVSQLSDPTVNAAVAVSGSSNGSNWSAWETYANGAYKAFLNTATTPNTAGLPASGTTAATLTSAGSASGSACALSVPLAGCILPKSALRGILGGLLLGTAGIIALAGAVILAASAFEHSGAASAAAQSVTPVRAVVNTAKKIAPKDKTAAKPKKP